MTFSIVAHCAETGQFGLAISSSSPAVAARCVHTRAEVGAVASQNITDPALGTSTLDLLQQGLSASDALTLQMQRHDHMDFRQLLIVDTRGQTAAHSGPNALGIWGAVARTNVASGGNLLASDRVPKIMADAFDCSTGALADRLLLSLRAGLDAGGEAGPVHSAGLQVCDKLGWPLVDLRCDWTEDCPVDAVESAWRVYKPQVDDYVNRALYPGEAPAYGVPGEKG
ncbi:MAG: DUF1028 domain-containing protein [Granulosicoccus sp.]